MSGHSGSQGNVKDGRGGLRPGEWTVCSLWFVLVVQETVTMRSQREIEFRWMGGEAGPGEWTE